MLPRTFMLLLLLCAVPVHAQQLSEKGRLQAKAIMEEAATEFERGDIAKAEQLYEAAYTIYPSDKMQYGLGRVYEARQRWLAAVQAFQRFLTLPESDRSEEKAIYAREALKRLAQRVGRLLVYGDAGQVFTLDDDPQQQLPHPLIYVVPGAHRVRWAKGQEEVTVAAGSLMMVKLTRVSGLRKVESGKARSLVLALPPHLPEGVDAAAQQMLGAALSDAAQIAGLQILEMDPKVLESAEPELIGCEKADCLERLGQTAGARLVVTQSWRRTQGDWQLQVAVFDSTMGAEGARDEVPCAGCTVTQAAQALKGLARRVLTATDARGRGTLQVNAQPNADVAVDGRRLGFTPFERPVFAGSHEVVIARSGYQSHRETVTIVAGEPLKLDVRLVQGSDGVVILREVQAPRPLWRKVVGGSLIGAGLAAVAGGVAAVWLDNKCTNDKSTSYLTASCTKVYNTGVGGYVGIGLGAAAAVGGLVVVALPGERRQVQESGPAVKQVSLGPVGSGYGFQFVGQF